MFEITHQDKNSLARTGVIHTAHGDFETPAFMPVGTQATVKALDSADLENLNAQIILANAYHLHLRPGEDLIAEFGGLHKFMNWNHPILTDSGGFQVFSLKQKNKKTLKQNINCHPRKSGDPDNQFLDSCLRRNDKGVQGQLVKIDDNGVTFRSHLDGSEHRFTPESAIEIQHKLGADIIMAFDECTPDDVDENYARKAMERTHRWAERCLQFHKSKKTRKQESNICKSGLSGNPDYNKQYLFGIIQGTNYKNLREESARFISNLDFDGIAIGGESIGYNMEATKKILDWINPLIPQEKPHYTMGVGLSPLDIFEVVEQGIDMFDCVAPTRLARNGSLFVSPSMSSPRKRGSNNRINITNSQFYNDPSPIDPVCTCPVCAGGYSRAYLHHLFKCDELLAFRLASLHNVRFMLKLMEEIREAIKNNQFNKLKKIWAK